MNLKMDWYNEQIQESTILELADNMAAAASTFNSHGYDTFIQSRETFKEVLHKYAENMHHEQDK